MRLEEKVPTSAIIRDVLLGLEALKPMKSTVAREMRQVLDGLTDFARRMRELGQERELDSFMTIEVASRKIDSGIYYEYMRQSKRHNHTLAELITYLRRETGARERREHPHSLSDNTNKSDVNYFRDKSSECDESLATLVDDGRAGPFCIDKTHLIIKCPIFTSKTKEERRRMIVSSKRCLFCLRANHNAINCIHPDKKRCVDCQLYHQRFVACPPYGNKVQPRTFSGLESSQAGGTSALNTNLTRSGGASECNIGHAREVASDADATFNIVGTLNSSADTTLVKLSTAKHYGLQGEHFKFRYGVAGGGIAEQSSAKFSIQIRRVNGIKSYNVIEIGIEKPAHNSPAVGEDIFDEYPHLNAAKGSLPTDEAEIDIIIGYDYYFLTMPVESVKDSVSPESCPVAVRSIFGWTIFGGNIPKPKPHVASRVQFLSHLEDLQKLYTSDVVGVKPTTLCVCSEESRDEGWYLQHHAVYQLHKSTKIRIIWNSDAKFNGLCLNDGFHKGPDFLNSLLYCLLHWRMKSIGIAGDVQNMFNQILMAEKDQRYHRFVWRFDLSSPIRHWQWLRLPFGDKPAPDIAMMAVRTLADTFKEEEPIGAQLINCRMYMDDVIESFDESELAIAAMDQVDRILEKGSFRIKEWYSNDLSVDRCTEDKQTNSVRSFQN
ncbi:uncharacterized protein [Palaemon carinicauda]|uniref:uncharacterized protein n=1 Tax=Palaemon carinicauda TaxID=392227 RepID=UPI0035B576D7